jgi:hypothetical protein
LQPKRSPTLRRAYKTLYKEGLTAVAACERLLRI